MGIVVLHEVKLNHRYCMQDIYPTAEPTSPYDTVNTVVIVNDIDGNHVYSPSNTACTVSCILCIHL